MIRCAECEWFTEPKKGNSHGWCELFEDTAYKDEGCTTGCLREPDLTKCPRCGGPADNGHDRCDPPSPYFCTKCSPSTDQSHPTKIGGIQFH